MPEEFPGIVIVERRIAPLELRRLVDLYFGDMVKYVADLRRLVIALGGELHADAKAVLLAAGSRQDDLWGANYYPGRGAHGCIESTSLINIRPARGNPGMEILDPEIRETLRRLTFDLLGEGEVLR
jgi:hypothetical protein